MNTKVVWLLSLMALTGPFLRADVAPQAAPGAVSVTFANPEKYTDVKSTSIGSDRDRDAILEQFKAYVEQALPSRVQSGQTLAITFKDIDMAGDFEPWRVDSRDVRIVKDLYPPRIKLSFKLTDATGSVVKEGDRSLSDLTFMNLTAFDRQDDLRYEKRLLADWADTEFAKKK